MQPTYSVIEIKRMLRVFFDQDIKLLEALVHEEKNLYTLQELGAIYKMMMVRMRWLIRFETAVHNWHVSFLIAKHCRE